MIQIVFKGYIVKPNKSQRKIMKNINKNITEISLSLR